MKGTVLLWLVAQNVLTTLSDSPAAWTPPPEYAVGTFDHKTMYLADITVGSNGQPFRVLVDTGSSTLVLPSKACKDEACVKHNQYAANDSQTSTVPEHTFKTMTIGFGLGKVQGHVFEDEVCMTGGSTAPLTEVFLQASVGACAKMAFLAADAESADLSKMPYDGILGLGLDDPNVQGTDFSFLRQLVTTGKLSSPTFALRLGNDGQSSLSLGGVDEKELASGRMSWWDLSSYDNGYWQFSACDLTLDGEPQNFGKIEVAVDSGTSLLAADDSIKGWMEDKLRKWSSDGCTSVNHMPRIGLKRHDGSSLELLPSDYVDQREGACTLALMPNFQSVNGQRLILGDSFLRRYVTVFDRDNKKLGFGVSADDSYAPQLVDALFPASPQASSSCEDHELNKAFSKFADGLGDIDGNFQAELRKQSSQAQEIAQKVDGTAAPVSAPVEVEAERNANINAPEGAMGSMPVSSTDSASMPVSSTDSASMSLVTAAKAESTASASSGTPVSSTKNDYLSYLKLVQLHDRQFPDSKMGVHRRGGVITVPLHQSIPQDQMKS